MLFLQNRDGCEVAHLLGEFCRLADLFVQIFALCSVVLIGKPADFALFSPFSAGRVLSPPPLYMQVDFLSPVFQNSVDTAKPLLRKAIQISQQTPYWHCRLLFQLAVSSFWIFCLRWINNFLQMLLTGVRSETIADLHKAERNTLEVHNAVFQKLKMPRQNKYTHKEGVGAQCKAFCRELGGLQKATLHISYSSTSILSLLTTSHIYLNEPFDLKKKKEERTVTLGPLPSPAWELFPKWFAFNF